MESSDYTSPVRPDETTSHSTRPSKDNGQVAGYVEGSDVTGEMVRQAHHERSNGLSGINMPPAVRTTCPYCGVGCGVAVSVAAGTVTLTGDKQHPANLGRLCSKGAALAETLDNEGRLLYPIVDGQRASWDEALGRVAEGFKNIIAQHGSDAVAFYVSGQLLTEDYYVANKLMKGFIGSANIDTNSRLCMSSAVAAHKRAFGADAVPVCYEDIGVCQGSCRLNR